MKFRNLKKTKLSAKGLGSFFKPFFYGLLLVPLSLLASPIQQTYDHLTLNAEYQTATDKNAPFFIILHGTFAWHGMELPSTIQALLSEEAYGSLAFSLSLGEDNRSGFFDCSHPIISKHQDAQQEIKIWLDFVKSKGYKNIVLVGHSRGGAQIAQFVVDHPAGIMQAFLIAPMTYLQADSAKAFDSKDLNKLGQWLNKAKTEPTFLLNAKKILHCDNAKISLESLVSYYSPLPVKNTPNIVARVQIPTRIYLGSNDPSITHSINQQESLYLSNKKVSRKVIQDADHYFRDFAAEDMVADMLQQLRSED